MDLATDGTLPAKDRIELGALFRELEARGYKFDRWAEPDGAGVLDVVCPEH